jgi:hypothetical protein
MQEPLPPAGAQQSVHHGAGWGVDGRTGHGSQVGDRTVICGHRTSQRDRACRVPEHGPEAAISAVSSAGTTRAHRRSLRRGRPCCCEPPAPTELSSSCRSLKLTLRLRLACPLSNEQQCHGCVSEGGPRAGQVGVVPPGACGLRAGVRRVPVTHRPGGRGRRPLVRRCARGGQGRQSRSPESVHVRSAALARVSPDCRGSRRSVRPGHHGTTCHRGCGHFRPVPSTKVWRVERVARRAASTNRRARTKPMTPAPTPQSAASTRNGLAESAVQPLRAHFGLAVLLTSSS